MTVYKTTNVWEGEEFHTKKTWSMTKKTCMGAYRKGRKKIYWDSDKNGTVTYEVLDWKA